MSWVVLLLIHIAFVPFNFTNLKSSSVKNKLIHVELYYFKGLCLSNKGIRAYLMYNVSLFVSFKIIQLPKKEERWKTLQRPKSPKWWSTWVSLQASATFCRMLYMFFDRMWCIFLTSAARNFFLGRVASFLSSLAGGGRGGGNVLLLLST